jgi:diaminohydroxyphosphoribosylaminopyrimidine deaminase/5-amino-6-(5-phosphoribosylamino)uracil reductase
MSHRSDTHRSETHRTHAETAAMLRAVALAARGLGCTSPNPVVGAVVLSPAGEVVGQGWHERAGGPHAEVRALRAAGERARGATVVVTLEPCTHTGRTGPCTQALLAAGIARVVLAVRDPDPVAAGGVEQLRAAGVDVVVGLGAAEAARGNESWLTAVRLGRPHVLWKLAATLDGRVAAADGTSRWITGKAARADAHRVRAGVDAIVVGTGTALADDPRLTVRLPGDDYGLGSGQTTDNRPRNRPLRVVVGTRSLPQAARVLDDSAPTLVLATHDVGEVLATLYDRGVRSVLLEGGPTLAGAFIRAGAVDRVLAYLAPALLGAGPAALTGTGICTLGSALRLQIDELTTVGADIRISARPAVSREA